MSLFRATVYGALFTFALVLASQPSAAQAVGRPIGDDHRRKS